MARLALIFLWVITLVQLIGSCPVEDVVCNRGQYRHCPTQGEKKFHVCVPCDNGTFMPADGHIQSACYNCSTITDNENQVTLSECNSTHDAVIIDCRECRGKYDTSQPSEQTSTGPASPGVETATPCPVCPSPSPRNETRHDVDRGSTGDDSWMIVAIVLIVLCCFLIVGVVFLYLQRRQLLCFRPGERQAGNSAQSIALNPPSA